MPTELQNARMKPKPLHPADQRDNSLIVKAIGFIASLFTSKDQMFHKRETSTISEARQAAIDLVKEHNSSRKAIVYAIVPSDNGGEPKQVVVPDYYQAETETADKTEPTQSTTKQEDITLPAKTFPKRFNAQRSAQRALKNPKAVEGVDFETVKTEGGWAVRSKVVKLETKKVAKPTRSGFNKKALEISATGKLPAIPDFSAETHRAWRKKLAEVVALVKAGDVKALKRYKLPTYSSSPRAIAKYRDLAVMALEAKAKQAA